MSHQEQPAVLPADIFQSLCLFPPKFIVTPVSPHKKIGEGAKTIYPQCKLKNSDSLNTQPDGD